MPSLLPDSVAAYHPLIGLILLFLLFAGFVVERLPPVVVATLGALIMLLLGFISTDELLGVFSNPAPITIAAMFVLSGALVRTGLLDRLATLVIGRARDRPLLAVAIFLGATVTASAFVNNTPVVLVLIPVVVRLAGSIGLAPTRLLIPLSYAAIMGGSLTLIGTSTNLLVDGVARSQGMAPFGIFEILPVGLVVCTWGLIYMLFFADKLLPARDSMANMLSDRSKMKFFTEAVIPPESNLIGREVLDLSLIHI